MCCPIDYTHVFSWAAPLCNLCDHFTVGLCVFPMALRRLPPLCAFVKQVRDFSSWFFFSVLLFFFPFLFILSPFLRKPDCVHVNVRIIRSESDWQRGGFSWVGLLHGEPSGWLTDWQPGEKRTDLMPSFACHALSLSVSPSHPSSLITAFSPRFQLRDVYHHSQSRPAAPLATLTRAQVGRQLMRDQQQLPQKRIRSHVGEKVQHGGEEASEYLRWACVCFFCLFFSFFVCRNKSHADFKIKQPIHKHCEFIYSTCHEVKINNACIFY